LSVVGWENAFKVVIVMVVVMVVVVRPGIPVRAALEWGRGPDRVWGGEDCRLSVVGWENAFKVVIVIV
jgi:hypothetical protein